MTRRSWTTLRKLKVFEAHKGKCHICGTVIDGTREAWELEHIIPVAMGGADDETNAAPAHVACHKGKTATDKGQIAKANRVRAKHNGAKVSKYPLPFGRDSDLKQKIGGGVVNRKGE